MPQMTDAMFKFVIIYCIFFPFWIGFNILYATGVVSASGQALTMGSLFSAVFAIFSDPILGILDAVLTSIGVIGGIIIVRELLPV
jgi:hypothetical protein